MAWEGKESGRGQKRGMDGKGHGSTVTDMDLAPLGERPLGGAPVVMDLVGPLQEAQEAEVGAGSGIASPNQDARQLLPEVSLYT